MLILGIHASVSHSYSSEDTHFAATSGGKKAWKQRENPPPHNIMGKFNNKPHVGNFKPIGGAVLPGGMKKKKCDVPLSVKLAMQVKGGGGGGGIAKKKKKNKDKSKQVPKITTESNEVMQADEVSAAFVPKEKQAKKKEMKREDAAEGEGQQGPRAPFVKVRACMHVYMMRACVHRNSSIRENAYIMHTCIHEYETYSLLYMQRKNEMKREMKACIHAYPHGNTAPFVKLHTCVHRRVNTSHTLHTSIHPYIHTDGQQCRRNEKQ